MFACFHYFLIISSAPSLWLWPCLGSEPTFSSSSSNLLSTASANCYLPLCCAFPIPGRAFVSVCTSPVLSMRCIRERNTPGMNQLEVSHERILALYFLSSSIHNRNTSNWDRSRCCWKHGSQKYCFNNKRSEIGILIISEQCRAKRGEIFQIENSEIWEILKFLSFITLRTVEMRTQDPLPNPNPLIASQHVLRWSEQRVCRRTREKDDATFP
jgi:hypothetical protein